MKAYSISRYYPVSRYRRLLTQEYISNEIENGLQGFQTYKEAKEYLLHHMDIDDCDYEVCVYVNGRWFATRDGKTMTRCFDNSKFGSEM